MRDKKAKSSLRSKSYSMNDASDRNVFYRRTNYDAAIFSIDGLHSIAVIADF